MQTLCECVRLGWICAWLCKVIEAISLQRLKHLAITLLPAGISTVGDWRPRWLHGAMLHSGTTPAKYHAAKEAPLRLCQEGKDLFGGRIQDFRAQPSLSPLTAGTANSR